MAARLRLGSGLSRFLHQLVTLVADGNLARAEALLTDLGRVRALTAGVASYPSLDLDRARHTVSEWLRGDEFSRFGSDVPSAVRELWPALVVWDRADVPLPCDHARDTGPYALMQDLVRVGLIKETAAGRRLSVRLRLMLWCGQAARPDEPGRPALSLLQDSVRALRRQGRWIEAGRLAHNIIPALPGKRGPRCELCLTDILGQAQQQDYRAAIALLDDATGLPWPARWITRLTALRSFMVAESGDLRTALALAHAPGPDIVPTEERFWLVLARCWIGIRQGGYLRAERQLARLLRRRSERVAWIDTLLLNWRASALLYLERYEEAAPLFEAALHAANRSGWQDRAFILSFNSALGKVDTGKYLDAERQLRRFIARSERDGYLHLLPGAWTEMARINDHVPGRPPARWAFERALQLAEQTGALASAQFIAWGLANRANDRNQLDEAERYLHRLAGLSRQLGQPQLEGVALWELSRVCWVRSEREAAFALLEDALRILVPLGQHSRAAAVCRRRAQFLLELERLELAAAALDAAAAHYRLAPGSRDEIYMDLLRLELAIRTGHGAFGEADLDAIRLDPAGGGRYLAYAYALLAIGFACLDDWLTARAYARDALSYLDQLGYEYFARRVLDLAHRVKNRSRAARELVSYWQDTLPYSSQQL